MSYLIIKEDFNSFAYNILTRGLTLGLGSDYLRSLTPIPMYDTISYNEYGFMNEYGCFSPDAGRFFKLFEPKQSFYDKIFKYVVKMTNKDDRIAWFYKKFFQSKINKNLVYKLINKAAPNFGKGLMNTTTIDYPIRTVNRKDKTQEQFFILFITFDSSKIVDIKILSIADPAKDSDLYQEHKDSLGWFPMETDLANILQKGDYIK